MICLNGINREDGKYLNLLFAHILCIVNVQVDPGTYKYNFQCILPAELPTSVEGKLGHIRYTARVVIDFSFWINKEFKQRFTVIKAVDLNNDPTLRVIFSISNN